jgi:hypothetical protein
MKKLYVFIFINIILISCSNNKKPRDFDYGRVEINKYINSFFQMEINLPPDWIVQTKEQINSMAEKGKDLAAGDDKNLKAVLNASEVNSANLLGVFQYEVGSPVEYNPNFVLVAENLRSFPGVKNGSDYLFQTRKLLKQSQLKFGGLDQEFKKVNINDQEFYLMNASLTYGGITISQEYYSTVKGGFSISAIISYVNPDQKNDLDKIINSIKFNN